MTLLTALPELMHTDDRGGEFWRVRERDLGTCRCGLASHYSWRDEDARMLGYACTLRCAERRRAGR